MNNYLKSFLKLADEVLCESYTINNPDNSSKQTLEDIKRVLKYRFGLDFDKDIRYIVSSDFKSRKDKDSYLPRILRKMTKFLDQKISYRFISDATLDIPLIKTCITQDIQYNKYIDNMVYYIMCNMYLVLLNINDDMFHNYNSFDDYFPDNSNGIKITFKKKKFNSNKLTTLGRQDYKDSFLHILFASPEALKNEENNADSDEEEDETDNEEQEVEMENTEEKSSGRRNRKRHQWCEANDAVCISTVYNSNYSPFSGNTNKREKGYSTKRLCKFRNNYFEILKSVHNYNCKVAIEDKSNNNSGNDNTQSSKKQYSEFYYLKRDRYSESDEICERHASAYLSDMVYGFKLTKVISNTVRYYIQDFTGKQEDYYNALCDALMICSELMCIPDAYNRNIYAQNITETVFEMYLNYSQNATEKLHDEIKQFVLYQSKIYYYIIMTYAFLTIDYILKNENPSEVNNKYDAEAYVRKIIGCGLEAINKPDLSRGQLPYRDFFIEDFDCFYRSVKRRIFNRETFDAYFNNDLFSVDVNVHEITEVLFKYLKKDHDISFGPKDQLNQFV